MYKFPHLKKLRKLIKQDFARHGSSLRELQVLALINYRFGQWLWTLPKSLATLGGKLYGTNQLCIEMLTGIVIHRETQIGENLHLVHSGNIKIHPHAIIGNNVGIMHDVTIGQCSTKVANKHVPIIGDNVFIGAGAKILGKVKVGKGAIIAANSLVITDVPPGETVMGVPAVPLRYAFRMLLQVRRDAFDAVGIKAVPLPETVHVTEGTVVVDMPTETVATG